MQERLPLPEARHHLLRRRGHVSRIRQGAAGRPDPVLRAAKLTRCGKIAAHAGHELAVQLPDQALSRLVRRGALMRAGRGVYFITETMALRHQLSMKSYDRLFPNQDTLPRGGFGNLIAAPLQHEPRSRGNTVFLDERFEPYPDQWVYLASVQCLEPPRVEAIAQEAVRKGGVLGVRVAEPLEGDEAEPWKRAPSGRPRAVRVPGPLLESVRVVRAQRLFVEKAGLPSALLNQIKRLAAFQNPEFYKRQSMRLSTALTPRIIICAEEFPEHVALPRGCEADLAQCLADHGIELRTDDKRSEGEPIEVRFQGELTRVQEQAARDLIAHDIGVFVAPPGVGKTVLGTYLIARRAVSTLVLVHRRPLLDQWVAQLAMFSGSRTRTSGGSAPADASLTVGWMWP